MKNHVGSFEQTIEAVRGLSEHRLKTSMPVVSQPRPRPKVRRDALKANIILAVQFGWCSAPVKMVPTTDSDYARFTRENSSLD